MIKNTVYLMPLAVNRWLRAVYRRFGAWLLVGRRFGAVNWLQKIVYRLNSSVYRRFSVVNRARKEEADTRKRGR
jgi:hypothetical protein